MERITTYVPEAYASLKKPLDRLLSLDDPGKIELFLVRLEQRENISVLLTMLVYYLGGYDEINWQIAAVMLKHTETST